MFYSRTGVSYISKNSLTMQSMQQNGFIWHEETVEECLRVLETQKEGLSSPKALSRIQDFGKNELPREKVAPWWRVLVQQFIGPMVMVLVVAALLSAILQEWVDTSVIVAAILLNTTIGFFQEYKANKSLEQLRSLVQPKAMVRRDGKDKEIDAQLLVPGDLLVLQTGDQVTADARIIELSNLEINEAALTGESMPIKKKFVALSVGTVLAERVNMVYAGTNVVAGHALAVIVATGLNTEIGKIAQLVKEAKETKTPLQVQLQRLAKWLSIFIVIAICLLFLLGIMTNRGWFEMIELSIALAVAAIPEGLLLSVTVVLAIGMQRILKRKSLVRRLIAAETLGSVSVICSDKTGTITEGEMRVVRIATFEQEKDFTKANTPFSSTEEKIIDICLLCNDAAVSQRDGENREFRGSSTERALLMAGYQAGKDVLVLKKENLRLAEIPFDSAHKFMATIHSWNGKGALLMKGAPEKVLASCSQIEQNGETRVIDLITKEQLEKTAESLTEEGLRLIAIAYKPIKQKNEIASADLQELFFLGFVCLRDPLRKEAKEQIEIAKKAGVRTVIITGDHPKTAQAIGREAGIVTSAEQVVVGLDLDAWSDKELQERVPFITIYARVEPRHKIRIVNAWKARGEVVAMTGDGVNDAPALKAADIGVALGSGTEVAKQSSDLVLLNNDLGTITAAIEQGRVIFDNIRKIVIYLLTSSFTEIILIGGAILFGYPTPLLAVHILWINIVQDSFPSMALTLDPGDPDILSQPPRPRSEPVLNKESLTIIFFVGLISDMVLFFLFLWYLATTQDVALARTVMFIAVGLNALLYVFSIRSLHRSIFRMNPFSNPWLIGGVVFGFGFMFFALFVPFMKEAFALESLRLFDWGILLIMGVLKVGAIEVVKCWFNRKSRLIYTTKTLSVS